MALMGSKIPMQHVISLRMLGGNGNGLAAFPEGCVEKLPALGVMSNAI